ncbi:uncharacterized protein EDB91DRAFT_1250045 [Suillus paluster]|uniref:uncharacterized protein n=1 Tax=Suillus paluster TaxID=48578 RepID=UPI001B85B67F|nr:uncharacterized protein EDB91DRAFT_1250045 [Suillus paluster]KAG1736420.1 hypothetical protein EDB91DRAFT_1250045 [Suillus paluster]
MSTTHSPSVHSLPSCASPVSKKCLTSFCMSWIDDDALGSVVKSWSLLQWLDLGTAYFWQTRPRITFRGLVTLLSSYPNLTTLGLIFDATNVDPPTAEKPGGGVYNTHITSFCVGCSSIELPPPVAIALSVILPCLRKTSVKFETPGGPDRDAREAKWNEVSECIRVYTLIRKQEDLTSRDSCLMLGHASHLGLDMFLSHRASMSLDRYRWQPLTHSAVQQALYHPHKLIVPIPEERRVISETAPAHTPISGCGPHAIFLPVDNRVNYWWIRACRLNLLLWRIKASL